MVAGRFRRRRRKGHRLHPHADSSTAAPGPRRPGTPLPSRDPFRLAPARGDRRWFPRDWNRPAVSLPAPCRRRRRLPARRATAPLPPAKPPAKPLAKSFSPKKQAAPTTTPSSGASAGTAAVRTDSPAARADRRASTAAAEAVRAAATRRLFRRSPQGLELPPYEKRPLHPSPRWGGTSRRLTLELRPISWGHHANSVRRGQPKARMVPDRLNFSVLINKEKS